MSGQTCEQYSKTLVFLASCTKKCPKKSHLTQVNGGWSDVNLTVGWSAIFCDNNLPVRLPQLKYCDTKLRVTEFDFVIQ